MDHHSVSPHLDVHLDEHLGMVEVADEQPLPLRRAVRPERTPAAVLIPDDQETREQCWSSTHPLRLNQRTFASRNVWSSVEPPNALNTPIIELLKVTMSCLNLPGPQSRTGLGLVRSR